MPGPVLVADQGDTVNVTVHNDLTVPTSVLFDGQPMVPDLTGVGAGATKGYSFKADQPGTYLYEAGLLPGSQYQVSLGMYGALIVRPAGVSLTGVSISRTDAGAAVVSGSSTVTDSAIVATDLNSAVSGAGIPSGTTVSTVTDGVSFTMSANASATGSGVVITRTDAAAIVDAGSSAVTDAAVLATDLNAAVSGPGIPSGTVITAVTDGVSFTMSANAAAAYGASSAFNDEAVVILGEIDPALNNSSNPQSFDLRYFAPTYGLVNGVAYSGSAPAINVTSGNTLLLRYVNAGIQHHSIGVLGLRQSVLAADGSEIAFPRGMVAETIAPGQSADVLVSLPATTAASTKYALYDASMTLNNATASGIGGMLAFIDAAPSGSSTGDTVGPITSSVSINMTTGDLAASVSDATTGNANVTQAEYFIDGTGAAGGGTPMTGAFGSPTVAVSGSVTLASLSSGPHAIYVHGLDSLGNWGSFSSTSFTIDLTGPATTALVLTPSRTNGTVDVGISATGDDSATGNGNVTAAEYAIDGGTPVAMALNRVAPTVSLTGTIAAATVFGLTEGAHTVSVRSQDAAGNWGAAASVTLTVDRTGPATTNVTINPPLANNGKLGQGTGNPSVRVTATFVDATTTVAAGEGFIDNASGADGTGFTFTATDGVFNAAGPLGETGYADIPLTTINLLTPGNHTIYVHGKDAAGNWTSPIPVTSQVTILIDKTVPTFTGLSLAPNPTYGAASVTLTVNGAVDPLVASLASGITGGEYWIDGAAPAAGSGTAFTGLTATIPVGTLGVGSHTVGARIRDAAGNWSTTASASFTVVPDAIFSNGFDTGVRPWGWTSSSTTNTTRLNVTTSPALVGTRSLQAQGNNTNYVQLNFGTATNPASPTYDARFYFRPNGNTSTGKDILVASSGTSNTSFTTPLFRVRYRLNGANPEVQIQAGATANASWVTVLGGTSNNVIEVTWQSPGNLVLYVNGTLSQTLAAGTGSVTAVRLGSVTTTGNNTLMYFDAFASKRTVSPLVGP